jgi:hypothetical protein
MYDDVWEPDKPILTGTKRPNNKKPVAKRHSNRAVPAAEAAHPVTLTPCTLSGSPIQEGALPEGREAPAMSPRAAALDIPLRQIDQNRDTSFRRMKSQASRRFYTRALLGMKIPGNYYFLTYTTCMTTEHPVGYYWHDLWRWHRRYRPGAPCCYGITGEGKAQGVIHMIIRLNKGQKRMDVKDLRAHWKKMTGAYHINIQKVDRTTAFKLANYISDQRKLRNMAGEMAWQDFLQRWRWTTGWLPKGFTRAYSRTYARLIDAPPEVRNKAISDWLNACHLKPEKVGTPPRLRHHKKVRA